MKKSQLDEVIKKMVKKEMLKEETAYERGADRNLKKKLMDIVELNQAYIKRLNEKKMEVDEFQNLISNYLQAIKDFKLYSQHWDN